MTRVNINGAGHQVEVDHDGADLAYVVEKTQKLWDDTKPDTKGGGPAFGYSAQANIHVNGGAYNPASFRHGERPVVEP